MCFHFSFPFDQVKKTYPFKKNKKLKKHIDEASSKASYGTRLHA